MIDETLLDAIPLLRDLNPRARRELAVRGVPRRFAEGEVIWRAGTAARGLFVLLEGRVRVVRVNGGRQHVVHTETRGATMGEVPLFSGGTYPATAIADAPALFLVLDRSAVEAAMAEDPRLALALLERLARRVRTLIGRLDAYAAQTVKSRLAERIVARQQEGSEGPVTLGATQADVAEEIGTVREVVVKTLRELCTAGVLRRAGRARWEVLDGEALRRVAAERG